MRSSWATLRVSAVGFAVCAVLLLAGPVGVNASAPIPPPTPQLWQDVPIVPMPRCMRLTGQEISLLGSQRPTLVLGAQPSRQAQIGVEWINQRLQSFGGTALTVAKQDAASRVAGARIFIGTTADNPDIAKAVNRGVVDVGPGNPGKRGYEIRADDAGSTVYLAGADDIGALYACVTFAELIRQEGDRITWTAADVRDWPDCANMTLGLVKNLEITMAADRQNGSAEARRAYVEAVKQHLDRLLRWKVTAISQRFEANTGRARAPSSPEDAEAHRELVAYATERGIALLDYAEKPFVGLRADHPTVESGLGADAARGARYGRYLRGWAPRLDPIRRQTAAKMAERIKASGATDVAFHDTDTGGFHNPAGWNERSEEAREYWGDDYAGATIRKHMIFHDAIRAAAPDVRFHFVVYPYRLEIFDPDSSWYGGSGSKPLLPPGELQRWESFWQRLAADIPDDVTFAIREATPPAVRHFRELVDPHGLFVFFMPLPHRIWTPVFHEGPSWTGTFTGNPNDFLFPRLPWEYLVPLQALAVREYAWNANAPGSQPFDVLPELEQWRHGEPEGPIYDVVLPHLVRNLFGQAPADDITEAVRQNLDPHQLFNQIWHNKPSLIETVPMIQMQRENAARAVAAMDRVWQQCQQRGDHMGMSHYAYSRFIYLRELYHACSWMARIREQNVLARHHAFNQDRAAAEAAVDQGLVLIAEAATALEALKLERPDEGGEILHLIEVEGSYLNRILAITLKHNMNAIAAYEKTLQQTRDELDQLGPVPTPVMSALRKHRRVRIVTTSSGPPPKIDGKPDEELWKRAYPVETFFKFKGGGRVARAPTRVRMVTDADNLYLAFDCWVPGDEPVAVDAEAEWGKSDIVEAFFKHPGLQGDYVHFLIDAAANVRTQYNHRKSPGGWRADNDWVCPGLATAVSVEQHHWSAEIKIPLTALKATAISDGWTANFARICPLPGGKDASAINQPDGKDFHDVKAFAPIVNCGAAWYDPQLQVSTPNVLLETQTLSDRIASVARFQLHFQASEVLHDVRVTATTFDAQGRENRHTELLQRDMVAYQWQAPTQHTVEFDEVVTRGGVRITIETATIRQEHWVRVGGWLGINQQSTVFSEAESPAGGGSIKAPVHIPGVVEYDDSNAVPLVPDQLGCIEFWVRPRWPASLPPPEVPSEHTDFRRSLIHYGVMRPRSPHLVNTSSLACIFNVASGELLFKISDEDFESWSTASTLGKHDAWQVPRWHHVALVWDAGSADPLRVYLDGRQTAGTTHAENPDKALRLKPGRGWPIQVGCLTSGWFPAQADFDELRISRTIRYDGDFTPPQGRFDLDRETTALFHFDGTLDGQGTAPDGRLIDLRALPGTAALP